MIFDVMLVVHVLDVLLGGMLSTFAVNEVHALGLSELINFSTSKTDEELFGELVRDCLACKSGLLVMRRERIDWYSEKEMWTYPPCADGPRTS
jgi:hypothetical protein